MRSTVDPCPSQPGRLFKHTERHRDAKICVGREALHFESGPSPDHPSGSLYLLSALGTPTLPFSDYTILPGSVHC